MDWYTYIHVEGPANLLGTKSCVNPDYNYMYVHFFSIQRTAGFDLYIVFDPLIAKSQAILLGNKLIRWINVSNSTFNKVFV